MRIFATRNFITCFHRWTIHLMHYFPMYLCLLTDVAERQKRTNSLDAAWSVPVHEKNGPEC